ncbi:MAG: hypothetical protein NVV60_01395 [Luteimonas sp.]|nr:hypothetical protein [Luteimonas sp.]
MSQQFARFASSPIGTGLVARDGGLTLSTQGALVLSRAARSDIGHSTGTVGCEFVAWGDDVIQAVVGVVTAGASLNNSVGGNANGIGWRLHSGQVMQGNSAIATGLPIIGKGEIVGVRIRFAVNALDFYRGSALIHTMTLPLAGTLHFAATLAATVAGGLNMSVNAGQWIARGPAAAAAWKTPALAGPAARLADRDHLAAAGDAAPHARYEGLLVEGVSVFEALGFWPWGASQPINGTGAEATIIDSAGRLDALVMADTGGVPVKLRRGDKDSGVDGASPVARFALESVSVIDDNRRRLLLRDPHDDLDRVINRGVFLPNIPGLAWRPLPVVIGAVASVPALSCNSDGTTRWLSDSAVMPAMVMDRGSIAEMGTFAPSPDNQQLLMRYPPVGPVIADCSSVGVVSGEPVPASLASALADVFARIGKSAWSRADAEAIDTASGYAGIGYYAGDAVTARTAIVAMLNSYGAWFYRAPNGVLRFARIVAPESHVGELAFNVTASDMAADLVRRADRAPTLTRRMAYRLNAQALSPSDLVTDVVLVPQARRDALTGLWRGQVYAAGELPARYRHADTSDPFLSLLWREQDAQAEIDRVVGIYGTERNEFEASFRGTLQTVPKPGDIGRVTYPRYGLDAGKLVQVKSVSRVEGTGLVTLTMWG